MYRHLHSKRCSCINGYDVEASDGSRKIINQICFGVPSGKQLRARCSAGTDNLGNTAVASKLLTTKFPLCIFLMELVVQLQAQGAELHLHWLPRLQNVEADQLTNGDFTGSVRVRGFASAWRNFAAWC